MTNTENNAAMPKLIVITALSGVLFALGLLITERFGEIPVDIDWKPFFLPYILLALLPWGAPSIAIGLGAAIGEGLLDLLEGYEIDDPFGFVGYVVGFVVAGAIFGNKPWSQFRFAVGSIIGALVQAAFEGAALLVIDGEALGTALRSVGGNTVTHGIILGAIFTMILVPLLRGRIERLLGFAPAGGDQQA